MKKEKITTECGDVIVLTTDHATSSYGQPVAIFQGVAYGVSDVPPGEDPLPWLREEMGKTVACAARRPGHGKGPLTRRYIDLWRVSKEV